MTWMMMPPLAEDWASTEWMKTLQSSKPMEVILLCISWGERWNVRNVRYIVLSGWRARTRTSDAHAGDSCR